MPVLAKVGRVLIAVYERGLPTMQLGTARELINLDPTHGRDPRNRRRDGGEPLPDPRASDTLNAVAGVLGEQCA